MVQHRLMVLGASHGPEKDSRYMIYMHMTAYCWILHHGIAQLAIEAICEWWLQGCHHDTGGPESLNYARHSMSE